MAMPLPPPPRPPLVRGRLVGVGPPSPATSQTQRPMPPASLRLLRCRCQRSEGPWRTSTSTKGRRRWWSDEDLEEEEEDEEYEYEDGLPGGSAQQLFGEPWFSKLFRAYGYVLPLLLASMLVATGPKAFLMAMALPLAQSAISWVVSFFTTRGREQQEESYEYQYDGDPPFERREVDYDDYYEGGARQWQSRSYQQPNKSGSSFGGWDDLLYDEDQRQQESTGKRTTPPEPDTAAATADLGIGLRSRRGPRRSNGGMSRGRSGGSRRYNQAPLLTRLLVALFPFLGSWFRIL
ncbi:uncharacterized protein LOC102708567 [Oryza brachyantha]|uniref:uncharacterized protein LOC102708567 n=1 Tax=Oryza brachyantha TaxID=4533 RepID=UPI001ADC9846|nr:uncharacterized protein LOC102708567 [Oryza brachyantha]